jgi:hypothetical protein
MKILQSKIENNWVEFIPVAITKEEADIINSKDALDIEAKLILQNKINTKNKKSANEADVILATSLYNNIKPTLLESDVYELMSINLFTDNEKTSGALDYKINNQHLQIRF